ncbi:capsid protein [Leptospira sanjuanensis]|uniref:capsid protein n=1 Tax=Leptospira sanjuanensis TaxID=2879643 RepID=UPI001EE7AE48|nr:capsid protein [Leptospira sanjuanensis]MCG6170233.1 capsid protein [Leptospira sanjuanensis]
MLGPYSLDQLIEIQKSFQANTANNGASPFIDFNSSGATLSMQLLDKVEVALVSTDKDFKFLKEVPRRSITQTLAEYNRYKSHGGAWYHTSNIGQSDEPTFRDAQLERLYNEVSYSAEGFSFNKVVDTVTNSQDPELIQSNSALRRSMENQMRKIWFGKKKLNQNEQDGFATQVSALGKEYFHDCRGSLPSIDQIKYYSSKIRTKAFGQVNYAKMHPATKALYDQNFDRLGSGVVLQNSSHSPNQTTMSNIVYGIADSNSKDNIIAFDDDIWMDRHEWGVPMRRNQAGDWVEGATSDTEAPPTPILTIDPVNNVPGSLFTGSYVGDYKYRVCAGTLRHYSSACNEVNVSIPNLGAAELTITPGNGGVPETRYVIFRETAPDSNLILYMTEVSRNLLGATTIIQDLNETLPGTTIMIMGDFNSKSSSDSTRTLVLSELLPYTKTLFPYGAGGNFRARYGIVEAYNVLQILAPEKFRLFTNVPVRL